LTRRRRDRPANNPEEISRENFHPRHPQKSEEGNMNAYEERTLWFNVRKERKAKEKKAKDERLKCASFLDFMEPSPLLKQDQREP
jgi:hypothetical protein